MTHRILKLTILLTNYKQITYNQNQQQTKYNKTTNNKKNTPNKLNKLITKLITPQIYKQMTNNFINLPNKKSHKKPKTKHNTTINQ